MDTPIILIGPGTGIAPILSFLEERLALMEMSKTEKQPHNTIVLFGNRYFSKDFLHKETFEEWEKDKK